MVLKKYFGDKAFYKMILAIAVPIMIQNGITNFVSLLDNIMVGSLGTEAMSGVSIVNQFVSEIQKKSKSIQSFDIWGSVGCRNIYRSVSRNRKQRRKDVYLSF